MKKNQNIFTFLLDELKVKHTKWFSDKYYNEHGDKNNLYGISQMLSYYQIENKGIKIKEKDILREMEMDTPFIAHINNEFVVVYSINKGMISYLCNNKREKVVIEDFKKIWSGVFLLPEPDEKSIEPDYREHRKEEFLFTAKYVLLTLAIILLLWGILSVTQFYHLPGLIASMIINLVGFYVGYLLLLKQTRIYNAHAEKLCSLLSDQSHCNDVLESDAAKFMGFSWSEIGLGYFLTNVLFIILLPSWYSSIALLNIFTLPYTIWSIWYQKFKAKQWCPLCLLTQGILWLLFMNNLIFSLINVEIFFKPILLTLCVYAAIVIFLNLFVKILTKAKEQEKLKQELNRLKSNENIFNALMASQKQIIIDESTSSSIFLGNMESRNTVTIISNPYCDPCAELHKKVNSLLSGGAKDFRIQYILTSFGKDGDEINKLIISAYLKMDQSGFLSFLEEWYNYGRHNREEFAEKYPLEPDKEMISELTKQKEWIKKAGINSTPVVLYNGIKLPQEIYKLDDIPLITDMKLK